MSERVEDMRYELGRDAAQRGEALHENASEEFRHGYSSYRGFGSNVAPRRFGAGNNTYHREWECVCGRINARYLRQCFDCGLSRASALEATL